MGIQPRQAWDPLLGSWLSWQPIAVHNHVLAISALSYSWALLVIVQVQLLCLCNLKKLHVRCFVVQAPTDDIHVRVWFHTILPFFFFSSPMCLHVSLLNTGCCLIMQYIYSFQSVPSFTVCRLARRGCKGSGVIYDAESDYIQGLFVVCNHETHSLNIICRHKKVGYF